MRYLMGLILSLSLGFNVLAQENRQDANTESKDQCIQACLDRQDQSNQDQQNLNNQDQSKVGEDPCDDQSMERYENGSVYYHEDPVINESGDIEADAELETSEDYSLNESEGNAEMETDAEIQSEVEGKANAETESTESTDVTSEIREGAEDVGGEVKDAGEEVLEQLDRAGNELDDELESETSMENQDSEGLTASTSGGGLWMMKNQCALHRELDEREGVFEIKKEYTDGELKVEREKDGDESLKFESDTEIYTYEKNSKGETKYYYGIVRDNEMVEYSKDKDGKTDVIYHGVFPSPEDAASAMEEGVSFEGFSSVCSE